MRILVVDANLVFAKKVGKFLEEHVRQAQVEYATNTPILKRRLRMSSYDFVIADVLTAFDSEHLMQVLKQVEVPMILWTSVEKPQDFDGFKGNLAARIVHKPVYEEEFQQALFPLAPTEQVEAGLVKP